jgi:Zn-dependent protease with chaperone function
MEPTDFVTSANAVKGLAVLNLIPLVLYAIWADYYARYLDDALRENPDLDRAGEISRIRTAGLCGLLAQAGLILATSDLRHQAPAYVNGFCFVGIMAQAWMQMRLEKKVSVGSPQKTHAAQNLSWRASLATPALTGARAIFGCALGGALYIAVTLITVRLFAFAGDLFHAGPTARTALAILGGLCGVAGGLTINFALGAWHLRQIFAALPLPLQDPAGTATRALIEERYRKGGVRVPGIWVIESEHLGAANALVAGFSFGRGIFSPGLFISRGTLNLLTPDELGAVISHEISHLRLHHLRKRLGMTLLLVIGITFVAATFAVAAALLHVPANSVGWLGPIAAIVSFFASLKVLGWQSRFQEIQADIHAVEILGARLEDLESALRKIHQLNALARPEQAPGAMRPGLTHPSLEERIARLHAYFEFNRALEAAVADEPAEEKDRAA